MKLKYKQIIVFIIIILFSSLPLSFFILNEQEKIKIEVLKHRSLTECRILSKSIHNIVMMNGGSIPESKLDSVELINMVSVLRGDGLVFAEAILLSSKNEYNGIILASWLRNDSLQRRSLSQKKYSQNFMNQLLKKIPFNEGFLPELGEECYEFIVSDSPPGIPRLSLTRLVFSKKLVMLPLNELRNKVYLTVLIAIFLVTLIGILFGRIITQPVEKLIDGVEHISEGDFEYKIETGTRDEFGKLATTFNHLSSIIKLEISELKNANVELHRLDKLKDEFLASVSHELRTPLFGIIGLTESLMENSEVSNQDNTMEDLSLVAVSAKRLSHLINNILDISKLKHGDILIRKAPVDMYSVTQLVISVLMPLVDSKKLLIENKLFPGRVIVLGDEERLQQILFNVIGNAVKFTENGSVKICSNNYTEGSWVIIEIADTGIGISEDKFDYIFDSFAQVDGSNERIYSGTGLGLSITRNLVELHGGEIWCENNHPAGTVFKIKLKTASRLEEVVAKKEASSLIPYVYPEDQFIRSSDKSAVSESEYSVSEMKYHILVVDDEPVIRRLLQKILESNQYIVDTAETGEAALEYLRKENIPDLILLDIMLPKISGYDICRVVRESYSLYELPVLMLTAKNKPGDVLTGFEAGANDYITKPIERKELLARVNSLITFRESARISGELKVINHDLELAHEIQQNVLLKKIPEIDGISIAVRYLPMVKLGGDFYSVHRFNDNRAGFLIADVSGHGISAAFICAMLKVVYSLFVEQKGDPSVLFKRINENMFEYLNAQFITACFAVVDREKRKLFHTNAGHWPLLIWRNEENKILQVETKGLPFGWFEDGEYTVSEVDIKKGDRLIFYTDGIIEIRNVSGKMFSIEKFFLIIEKYHHQNADEFIDSILMEIRKWSKGNENEGYDDDVTIMVVDID